MNTQTNHELHAHFDNLLIRCMAAALLKSAQRYQNPISLEEFDHVAERLEIDVEKEFIEKG